MTQNRRSLVRRRKSQSKRRKSVGRSRLLLSPERLEDRTLLAADLLASGISPWQNPYLPTDVNFDFETTPLDALVLINSLNQSGARSLAPEATVAGEAEPGGDGEGEGGTLSFMDVNGDMAITPLDVLRVVDTINRGEGEAGDYIEFSWEITDLNGVEIPANQQTGVPQVVVGEEFLYQVSVRDNRSPPPWMGAFSAYPIVPVDFTLVSTAYQEEQKLTIDPSATEGTFNLQFGAGNVSSAIDIANLLGTSTSGRAAVIQTAIESLNGINPGDVEVSRAAYFTYNIVFTGSLVNTNVTDMSAINLGNMTSQGNPIANNTTVVQETVAADPNTQASFFSAYRSATRLAAGGAENLTYNFSPAGTKVAAGIMNIGSAADIERVGDTFEIAWAPGEGPTTPSLLFGVRFRAEEAGRLSLQLLPPAPNDGHTPDELTYWPSGAAGQGAELNLYPNQLHLVDFDLPAVVDIVQLATAVDDVAPVILEDSGQTLIDVLTNDSTVSTIKNLQSIVTQPGAGQGTASVNGTQAAYQTATDFNGQTTFVYRMNDGGVNTDDATVTVNVTAVNDAPEFTPGTTITIDEDDGAQTVAGWATGIRPGPTTATDEVGQTLTFNETLVNGTNLGAAAFVTLPSVDETTGNLTFELQPNVSGQAVVDISLSDDGGTANNGVDTSTTQRLTITINPVNDTPINSIDGQTDFSTRPQTLRTDLGSLAFSSTNGNELRVDDTDGNVGMQVTLSVSDGTLNVSAAQNVTIQNNGTATVTVSGNRDDVNAAIGGSTVTYTPDQGFIGTDNLVMTTSDLGNTGSDPGLTGDGTYEQDQDTVQIQVVPPKQPFAADDQATVGEDSGVSGEIEVLTNDFDGNAVQPPTSGTFEVVGFTQPPTGEGTVQQVGTGTATKFTYTTDQDFFGTTTFTYTVRDPAGPDPDSIGTVTVTVNPENDAPVVTVPAQPLDIDEDQDETLPAGAVTVTDVDENGGLLQGTVTVTNGTVSLGQPGPLSFTSGDGTDDSSMVFTGTLTQLQDAIDGSVFHPTDNYFGQATIVIDVNDQGNTGSGGAKNDTGTLTINIAAVNDAPEISAPTSATVAEDNSLAFTNGNTVSISDVEDDNVTVTITPTNGSTNVTTVSGTVAEVNAALAGLTFTPTGDYNGSATVTIGADDGGTNGTASHTVNLTVTEVNDAPTAVNDTGFSTNEETELTIPVGDLTNDDSAGPANESGQTLSIIAVSSSDGTVAVNGSVTFTPNQDLVGEATFTYTIEDDGKTNGVDDPKTAIGTVTVTVNGVNDAPVNNLPGNQTTDEDTSFTFSDSNPAPNGISVTDVDAGGNNVDVTISVDKGTLTLVGGAATDTINLTNTVANINTTLDGLQFTPPIGHNSNVDGLINLTMTTNDQGHAEGPDNSQVGTALEKTDSITIEVVDRNDAPLPQDDNVSLAEGATLTVDVMANDSAGPNEDTKQDLSLIAFDATTTRGGTVTLDDNGTPNDKTDDKLVYTPPNTDFNTVDENNPPYDTFTYTVEDDGTTEGQPDPKQGVGTVTVTVTEVNDAPVAQNDDPLLIPHDANPGEERRFSVSEVLGNDSRGPTNENGQTLRVTAVGTSDKGVVLQLDTKGTQDPADDEIVYTVPANFNHEDAFTYTVRDNGTTAGVSDEKEDTARATIRDLTPANITGYVYDDLNGNGQKDFVDQGGNGQRDYDDLNSNSQWDAGEPQEPEEPGIAGVTVTLTGPQGGPFVTQTDEDGYYIFPNVLPNLNGLPYTITESQPVNFDDGAEAVWSALNDANDQAEGADAVQADDVIQVTLPLLGYADGGNDNNNFGEMGLVGELSSVGSSDLLSSDIGRDLTDPDAPPVENLGLMFAVDANGNLQWKVNQGGWKDYVPGRNESGTYVNAGVAAANGNAWQVTDATTSQVHNVDLGTRVRWDTVGTSTVYRIQGGPSDFGLDMYGATSPGGEGEPITEDQTIEMVAAAVNPAEYAAAVDAAFAEAAQV